MSEPISDEQIQAIDRKCERQDDGQFVFGYDEAMDDIETLLQAIFERDAQLAQAWADLREAQQTIAELRKPAAVEQNERVEAIRREVKLPWPNAYYFVHAQAKIDIDSLLSGYDQSQQELARTHNAWQVAMVERDVMKSAYNSVYEGAQEWLQRALQALAERDAARSALAAAEARERGLRTGYAEAIEDIESWAGYASTYFQEKHDLKGCLERHRAALALPAEESKNG